MKLQTEHLEDNTARLIVELETADLDRAKRSAATRLSGRYKIPGFRKGKAPYNIVAKFVGEAAIVEAAVEMLADEVYPKALKESGLKPYANGSLEDVKLDPVPVYTFTLPLQAKVDLGDYESVRVPFEPTPVGDDAVERTMEAVRQQEARTTEVEGNIEVGQRITVDLHTHFVDGPVRKDENAEEEPAADAAEDAEASHDDDEPDNDGIVYYQGDEYIHRHDAVVSLNPDNEPFLPGFIDEIVGKSNGDVVEFDLVAPTDNESFANIAGRTIHFEVAIKKAESVELPELTDEFARALTSSEENPLDLAQLRVRLRENLEREAASEYDGQYADDVLEKITEGATLSFPTLMTDNRIDEMIEEFKGRLREQKISFELYKSITGIEEDTLKQQYRSDAERFVRRSLVLGEVMLSQRVMLTKADIDAEINDMVGQFGGDENRVRAMLNAKDQRENIANRLLFSRLMKIVASIGKGELVTTNKGLTAVPASTESD